MPDPSQTDLFGKVGWTPFSDTDTSLEAAHKVVPRAVTDERRVFEAIVTKPDTDEGLGERLRLPGNSLRPRRRSLEQKELVEHTGEYRETKAGRRAKVWGATAKAVGLLIVVFWAVGCCVESATHVPSFDENCYWQDKAGAHHVVAECWEHWTP